MDKATVLFLSTRNAGRSQMAEALLKHHAGARFDVFSAGLDPTPEIHPLATAVMQEIGVSIDDQRAKPVKEFLGKGFYRYAITVCEDAEDNCPHALWAGGTKLHWSFDNPARFEGTDDEKLNKFREIRDQIDSRIQNWLKEIDD